MHAITLILILHTFIHVVIKVKLNTRHECSLLKAFIPVHLLRRHVKKFLLTLIALVLVFLLNNIIFGNFIKAVLQKPDENFIYIEDDELNVIEYITKITNVQESKDLYSTDSFFIALSYFEQLTCGTRNLFSAGYVAENFGAKVVLPFLLHSRLYGIPDLIPSKVMPGKYFDLSTIYDIKKLNDTFNKITGTYLVKFEEFIYHAPREIMILDFPIVAENYTEQHLGLAYRDAAFLHNLMNFSNIKAFDCFHHVNKDQLMVRDVELMLRRVTRLLGVQEFVIKEYICIAPTLDISTDEIKRLIEEPRTILTSEWKGCAYQTCDIQAAHNSIKPFRNRILYSTQKRSIAKNFVLPFSDSIKLTAMDYLRRINMSAPYISLHIRIEKLQRLNLVINDRTLCCLDLLRNLIDSLKQRKFGQILMITDISEYGTDSCIDVKCMQYVRKVQSILTSIGLVQTRFNPKLTGSSESPAFVSLVEMNMLATGNRLVVIGGGSFKKQIINHFLQSNPVNNVYQVCTEEGNTLNEFSNLNRNC